MSERPLRNRLAQETPSCSIDGVAVPRIPYGAEPGARGGASACHGCGAIPGELHVEGCEAERCPGCGGQRFECDCEPYVDT